MNAVCPVTNVHIHATTPWEVLYVRVQMATNLIMMATYAQVNVKSQPESSNTGADRAPFLRLCEAVHTY